MSEISETSFPYRSINGDRKYTADVWADFFKALFTNGVVPDGEELIVSAAGGMVITLGTGRAMIEGHVYRNKNDISITLDPADGALSRIDSIVLRHSPDNRLSDAQYVAGTPSESPVAPTLTQDELGTFELARVDIAVGAGVTEITDEDITDNMADETRCGVMSARFDLDFTVWQAQMAALIAHLEQEIGDAEGGSLYELKRLVFDNTVVPIADFTAFEKTDGENWFDGYFEQGTLGDSDGAESASDYYVRSVNDIAVTAGDIYSYSDSIGNGARLFWYSDSAFISYSDVADGSNATAPTGATKLRIRLYDAAGIEPVDVEWCMVNYGSTALDFMDYIDAEVYPYQAKRALSGVLSNMHSLVQFGPDATQISAPVANTYTGGIKLYVSEIPAKTIVIPTIMCWKAV